MKAWAENKGTCYHLVLRHHPPDLETKLKNLARLEADTTDADDVALMLIILTGCSTHQT